MNVPHEAHIERLLGDIFLRKNNFLSENIQLKSIEKLTDS